MKISKIFTHLVLDIVVILAAVLIVTPLGTSHGILAAAEGFSDSSGDSSQSYPYEKTFRISAYYSPLPCQDRYVTGSYAGDIRLNGGGTNGADGTAVYPGMIAAPRTYSFGTKMHIPGVGITAVHDRGGAIVSSGERNQNYDRLDIWMGYGDIGLQRALNWGKRNIDTIVYGLNDSIIEEIELPGYSASEAIPNQCSVEPEKRVYEEVDEREEVIEETAPTLDVDVSDKIVTTLSLGDTGTSVRNLQEELSQLHFFKGEISGDYGDLTEHAVFKFQQSQGLVGGKDSLGAGVFGPKTKERVNEIITSRNYTKVLIAQATSDFKGTGSMIAVKEDDDDEDKVVEKEKAKESSLKIVLNTQLDPGESGTNVRTLQQFLKQQGHFNSPFITDYFGPKTQEAVLDFQLANKIVTSSGDLGAGRVGPATLEFINSIS